MAYRDNNKALTPSLKACYNGDTNSTLRFGTRPGSRNNNKPAGAGSVDSVNGKTPRPGYRQNKPQAGGSGMIARPGGAQKIK